MARPIMPSSASISRTRCPFASPPMAGLHDISPMVSRRWVSSSVALGALQQVDPVDHVESQNPLSPSHP